MFSIWVVMEVSEVSEFREAAVVLYVGSPGLANKAGSALAGELSIGCSRQLARFQVVMSVSTASVLFTLPGSGLHLILHERVCL